MKTILFKEIDGYEILTGFGNPAAEPEDTKAHVATLLKETDEYKQMVALGDRRQDVTKAYNDGRVRVVKEVEAAVKTDKLNDELANALYNQKMVALRAERDTQLAALVNPSLQASEAMEERRKQLARENPVYSEPRPGERIVDDAEVERLTVAVAAAGPGYLVDTSGAAVPDFRGKVFWSKAADGWTRQDVNTIGIEPAGKPYEDLSDSERLAVQEQLESERVAGLKAKEKEVEKAAAVESAAGEAALMRSKLEIQGDAKALDKAREWYDAEVVRLEAKYA